MSRSLRLRCIALLLCVAVLAPARPARADGLETAFVWTIVGIVAATAAITTVIVIGIRRNPSISGCVSGGPDGLQLASPDETRPICSPATPHA